MNAGATSERVYAGLKARLLGNEFQPGSRLDPTALADDLVSSVTPVRDALHLLAGEKLVEARIGDGFHVPHVTGPGLEDLYAWNAEIVLASLRRRVPSREEAAWLVAADRKIAERTAGIFGSIAAGSVNGEHIAATQSISDRLHAARSVEAEVLDDVAPELHALAALRDDVAALRKAVVAYHHRRRRAVPEIVRALYRAS